LVPGITDNDEALRKTRAFIETLGNVQKIEVLPYHNLGVYKFKELGIKYTLEGTPAPSKERVENAEKILRGQI
jgi:pyruvate formate lyase activating enzyme